MSQSPSTPPAGPSPAVAPALLERHEAGLRTYLAGLPGASAARVEAALQEIKREAQVERELEEDPVVWLFVQGRRRIGSGGQRGDVMVADAADDEAVAGEDARIAVHRAFERLTPKQQEVLRLKFQFGFNLEELARITNVSKSGAGGLLHSAVARICQATGASLMEGADVRLTAYALDELEPAEKQAFAESVSDGKALLESSDAIRKTGAQLAGVLESGAPLPKRSRRRQGGAGWKSPRALLVGAAVIAVGGLGWYFGRSTPEAEMTRDDTPGRMHGSLPASTRSRQNEAGGSGRRGDRADASSSNFKNDRTLRPGEAAWERKPFGQGQARISEEKKGVADAAQGEGETVPGGAGGGERSRGASSGPSLNDAPAADRLGESGESDATAHPGSPAPAVADEAAPSLDGASAPERAAGPAAGAKAGAAREMKSAKPNIADKSAPEPGSAEARKVPAPAPALGAAPLRRELAKKQWPKKAEVKIGELLRQTPPDRAAPENAPDDPLVARVEITPSPWKPDKHIVRVTIRAKEMRLPARPAANLVFAIDVSQSMAGPNRLPLAQEGIRLLAQRLRPEDRVAVIAYAAQAVEALPGIPLGEKALELRNCLTALEAGGQTNGYEGLQLAYDTARKGRVEAGLNAVVLCTDGNFNLGETDENVLAALAAQAAAEGITLSVFGFGRSDRNDVRLELLATKGGGRSCYVNTREEAERLLASQIDGLMEAAAKDVTLAVEFDAARVGQVGRLDGEGGLGISAAAQLLPGRSMVALYEVSLVPGRKSAAAWAKLDVSYRRPGSATRERMTPAWDGPVAEWAQLEPGFRFALAWAEFGRVLQGDKAAAGVDLDRLEDWVQRYLPDDTGGYRQELLDNVIAARAAASGK